MNVNDRPYLMLLLNIRQNFPSSKLFYYIYFSFKYYGLILATQNLRGFESKKYNITSIYSILSKFLLFDSSFFIISKYYQYVSLIILLFILSVLIYFLTIFYRLKSSKRKKSEEIKLNKFLRNFPNFKTEVKIFTYIIVTLSLFNPFIQEYLFIGIALSFLESHDIDNNDKYISKYYSDGIKINKAIILCSNILSLLISLLIDYFILYLNDTKGFISKFGIDIHSNQLIKIISLFLTLFQPIISFSYLFEGIHKNRIRFGTCISAVLICSLFLFLSFRRFNFYFDSQIPLFILFIICFSWYGGIFEIIMYIYIDKENYITQKYSIFKLILVFMASVFIFFLIKILNLKFFSNNLSINLFKPDEKNRFPSEIYLYFKCFYMFRKEPANIELFKILYYHKKQCQIKDCFCALIKNHLNIKKLENSLKQEQYAIIGEQEIVNRISYLFKMKRFTREIEDYMILHCQYIFSIRNREYYALYLCSMYLNCNLKIRPITKYFLYECKKEILDRIQSSKNIMKEYFLVSNYKNIDKHLYYYIQQMKKFFHFSIFSDNIKYLIKDSFKNLEIVLSFRKILKKSKINKMNRKSFQNFLKMCGKIKLNDEFIEKIINNYISNKSENDKMIKNNEICYILTNYYNLIHKKIPTRLMNKFNSKITFPILLENIDKDFFEFNMNCPLILQQNKLDNFSVIYCSSYLTNYLDYSQEEMKNKDFNDLIPYEIRKEHLLNLKQFSFIHNGKFKTSNSFILNKENCLVNISFNSRILPTLYSFVNIINNITIIKNRDKSTFSFHIFLDKEGYFLNLSKEFEEFFFFDIKKIKILNISFHEFFGIPPLNRKYDKDHLKQSLTVENRAYSVFLTIPNEKIFYLRTIKDNIKKLQNKKYHYESEIYKFNIFQGINNINNILDEKGLDNEWYNRTHLLMERFHEIKSNAFIKSKFSKKKNNISKNVLSKDDKDNNVIFLLDYYLKEIGNKKYYLVKITEKINMLEYRETSKNLTNVKNVKKKKKKIVHLNSAQTASKRSEDSQKTLIRSSTNICSISNTLEETFKSNNSNNNNNNNLNLNYNNIINSNNNNNNNSNIDNNSLSPSLNSSLINSKINLVDDSKTLSGINLIQNLANNEIKRINPMNNTINHRNNNNNNFFQKKKPNHPNYITLKNSKVQIQFLVNYRLFLLTSFSIVIILSIVLMIFKNKKIYEHKDLYKFNVYFEILKTDIYLSSLNAITICFQQSFEENPMKIQDFIHPKILSLKEDLSKFYKYLNKIKENSKLSFLYDSLYIYHNFQILNNNWKITDRNSSILDEINLVLYYMYQVYYLGEENVCSYFDITGRYFLNLTNNIKTPSNLENLIIYSMENTLQNFKPIFESLTTSSSLILINYYKDFFKLIFIYGCLIILFTFVCYFIIFAKLNLDRNEIKGLLIYIFDIEESNINQSFFENQIFHLRLLCENFNENNITQFEISKSKHSEIELSKLLHKNLKKNLRKGSLKFSQHKNNKQNEQKNHEELIEEQHNMEKNIFLPKSVVISYIVLTLCLILISTIVVINLIYAYSSKNTFIFAVIMAMNFLERMPKGCEMSLYIGTSLTYIDEAFIYEKNFNDTIVDKYLNYYDIQLEYKNNTQLLIMNKSYYPILYIEGKMVEDNLEIFLGKKSNVLKNTRKWEVEFNKENNLCFAAALGSLYIFQDSLKDIKSSFSMLNEKAVACFDYNSGSSKYGLLTEIKYMYQELTNLFYDFIKSDNKKTSYYYYLTSDDLSRIFLDFDYVFESVFKTYAFFVMKDIGYLYSKTIIIENLLSIISLLIVLFVIIYIFFWIDTGNNRHKTLLKFFAKLY